MLAFSLLSFKISFLSLVFCSLNMIYLDAVGFLSVCGFFFWNLSWFVFPEFAGSVFWCLSLILESSQIFLLFCSFFLLLLIFQIQMCCTSEIAPQCLMFISFFLFLFAFQFGNFYWPIFKLTDFFPSSAMSSLLMSPSELFFSMVLVFYL